jgi:uncharacterized protein
MKFTTVAKIGPHREVTPQGFTLFRDVSIARIGEQEYAPSEVGIAPGPNGLVIVTRTPEQVFNPVSMGTGNGASYVIDHPIEDVSPDNWQHLTHGFFIDVRRGSGEQRDELVADLLVTTAYGLAQIDSGKRELSVGYDADYYETGPGRAEQRNIVINHVASVDAGRCGERCSIKDHKHTSTQGATTVKKNLAQRILDAFKTRDEDGLKKLLDEESTETGAGGTQIHVYGGAAPAAENKTDDEDPEDPTEKRFKGIEDGMKGICDRLDKMTTDKTRDEDAEKKAAEEKKTDDDDVDGDDLAEEAPDGTQDKARKSRDSAYLVDSFERVKMDAEIISPGVKVKTLDRAADPRKSFRDCICGLRRQSLTSALSDADTAALVEQVRGRTTDAAAIAAMTSGQVRTLFNGVAALKRVANNAHVFGVAKTSTVHDGSVDPKMARFKADSAARWGKK